MACALPASISAFLLTAAQAAASAPCSTSNSLQCRLASILHLLYFIAAVLALVLLLALAFAIRMYRRNQGPDPKPRVPRS